MDQTDFKIKVIRQHWIRDDGKDDKEDLCSHGEVYIRIGPEEISNKESGSWTLSVTGLFLLRSLEENCELLQFSNQLAPCCGHFMIPDDNGNNYVTITGCTSGIDWKIKHLNEEVIFESEIGSKGKLLFDDYKKMVLQFTDEIESFYGNPDDKIVEEDEFIKNGFRQFWAEWKELKTKWK